MNVCERIHALNLYTLAHTQIHTHRQKHGFSVFHSNARNISQDAYLIMLRGFSFYFIFIVISFKQLTFCLYCSSIELPRLSSGKTYANLIVSSNLLEGNHKSRSAWLLFATQNAHWSWKKKKSKQKSKRKKKTTKNKKQNNNNTKPAEKCYEIKKKGSWARFPFSFRSICEDIGKTIDKAVRLDTQISHSLRYPLWFFTAFLKHPHTHSSTYMYFTQPLHTNRVQPKINF